MTTILDKLLGRPDAEEKLRMAARTLNGLLEEVGLEHKAMDGETPAEEKMTLGEEDIAAIVAKAIIDGMGENLPDNTEDIARAAASELLAAMQAMASAEATEMEDGPTPEEMQEERALRVKMTKAFDALFEENQALSHLIAEDNAEIVDAMVHLKGLPETVTTLSETVKALSDRVGVIQRQLSKSPRASIAAVTEVDATEVKENTRALRKAHPLYGEIEVK